MVAFPFELLPDVCFQHICSHLLLSDIPNLSSVSKSLSSSCNNSELWNLLLCQRLWTVDPSAVLQLNDKTTFEGVDWKEEYRNLVRAEHAHQIYLDQLKRTDIEGWLERHFIGHMSSFYLGWEARYWTWDSGRNCFAAWENPQRRHCYATFPVSAQSQVRRVSKEEQIALTSTDATYSNQVKEPKPFVFTVTHTTFPMLWACKDEEQLKLWLDKISVTLYPLKFGGRKYQAPAKYLMQRKKCSLH